MAHWKMTFAAFGLGLVSLIAGAESALTLPGPAPGSLFPSQLNLPDQAGKLRSLSSLMGDTGVALFFVRSADWCPFCKHQLVDAEHHLARFQKLGFNVASISVDELPLIQAFSAAQHIGYPMLADPKGAINQGLGIRDDQYPTGTKAFGVPRPILYLIDRNGQVRARYMEPTFRTRPDLDKVLADIEAAQH